MTDRIPLAGVIGSPIGHSRSPKLFAHWLKTYGLAGYYIPMEIASGDLERTLRAMPAMGFRGVNVTIPHKEAILEIADFITDRASLIGAANTLIFRQDGGIHADNTDGFGFIENLRLGARDWHPSNGPAVVLGAGGAARAVVHALLTAGVPEVLLTNRTRVRADAIAAEFGNRISVVDWVQAGSVLEFAALVVNTTSMGMVGKPDLTVSLSGLKRSAVVTDIVYTPLETTLLAKARAVGCTTVDGLGMLLYQAMPGFERWFGIKPEVTDEVRRAVLAQ